MENTLVSARVPSAKKEASADILKRLGATATDLINSAYDYLLENGELPRAQNAQQRADFASFVEATTLEVEWEQHPTPEDGDYKRMIRDWRGAAYESLA